MKFTYFKKIRYFCFLSILFFTYNPLSSFIFIANSDTHVGNDGIKKERKNGHIEKMLEMNNEILKPSFNLFVGDLTDHGYGEEKHNYFCCKKQFVYYTEELNSFINTWLNPLENTGVPIYLCAGNHDVYRNRKGITNFIKKKHGNNYYVFEQENVTFICCHIYPNPNIQNWLKNEILPKIPNLKPIIFFFHYPPIGKGSFAWTQQEKDSFFEIIQDHNILALIVGHHGKFSYLSTWKERIPVYCVAGKYFAYFDIKDREIFTVTFHSPQDHKDQTLMFYTPEELNHLIEPKSH